MGARAPVMVDHGGVGSKSDPAAGLAAAKICAVKLGMKRFGSAESPNRNLGVRRNHMSTLHSDVRGFVCKN